MSRSRRQTPIIGNSSGTEKQAKRHEHARWRVHLREVLAREDWGHADHDPRESIWWWPKDGKRWIGPADPRWLRK